MNVLAPGKLLLSGAYAVLEGAPAIVAALSRYAVAEVGTFDPEPAAEIAFAYRGGRAPRVSTRALYDGDRKLGIGSSAAALVAALGATEAEGGVNLSDSNARTALFKRARSAHSAVQSGGSGVDVAASVWGGVLRYSVGDPPSVEQVELPRALSVRIFASGHSARTSELRALVQRFEARDKKAYGSAMEQLHRAALASSASISDGDVHGFIAAAQAALRGLEELGRGADAPIVPLSFRNLARAAEGEGAAFIPSGAGGGDVGVLFSNGAASPDLLQIARSNGLEPFDFGIDRRGVHVQSDPGARPGAE